MDVAADSEKRSQGSGCLDDPSVYLSPLHTSVIGILRFSRFKCSLFLDTPTCLLLLQVSEHGAYWLTSCDLAFLSFHSRVYPLTMMSRYRKLRWRQ